MMLFFSVDMENSTKLKQARANGHNHKWLNIIMAFIDEFPLRFKAHRERIGRENHQSALPEPTLWKILGDELVFCVEICNRKDLICLVDAFAAALRDYNMETKAFRSSEGLGIQERLFVKGTGWVAGFPVTNAIISMQTGRDYVGPSMDLGFRLGRLATPRRFVVSVELAWLLSVFDAQGFHFEGRVELKGVCEATGYPLIWRQLETSEYQKSEDRLLGRQDEIAAATLRDLCQNFILEHGAPNYLPFLREEPERTPPPNDYEKDLALVIEIRREDQLGESGEPDGRQDLNLERALGKINTLDEIDFAGLQAPVTPNLRPKGKTAGSKANKGSKRRRGKT